MGKLSIAFVLLEYYLLKYRRWFWLPVVLLSYLSCSVSPSCVLPTSYTGQLSLDEFIDGARKDKWVMKMLQMDVNPGGWISEQRRKSALF